MNWLTKWFRRPERLAVFMVKGRHGLPIAHYDPAEIRRRLQESDPHWLDKIRQVADLRKPLPDGTDPEIVRKRLEAGDESARELAALVSTVFGLPPLAGDGAGWTEAERVGVLAEYLAYCQRLRETYLPLPVRP